MNLVVRFLRIFKIKLLLTSQISVNYNKIPNTVYGSKYFKNSAQIEYKNEFL